jgi:hypothetical protein
MRFVFILILLVLYGCEAYASLTFGTSLIYAKINDPSYEYADERDNIEKPKSLVIGYGTNYKNIHLNIGTNRLLTKEDKRKIFIGKRAFFSKTKLTYDMVQLGYRYNRVIPNIIGINAELKRSFNQYKDIKHVFLKGIGLNFILTEELVFNSFYIFPNEEIYLEGAGGIGLTYNY